MITTHFMAEEQKIVESPKIKPRIMVIDDNRELLDELQDMLELSGYEVMPLNDSSHAVDLALEHRPDLILLDLKMSPKSGFQIADEVRKTSLRNTPILAMTGFFIEKQHSLMIKLCGINKVILKPFMPVNLISQIEFALGQSS